MRKEDFKKITNIHLEFCKKLIQIKGDCMELSCKVCPFSSKNYCFGCGKNSRETRILAENFIKLFGIVKNNVNKKFTLGEMRRFYTYLKKRHGVTGVATKSLTNVIAVEKEIDNLIEVLKQKELKKTTRGGEL